MAPLGKRNNSGSKKKNPASLIKENKGLELTVAALLLTGKLKVDSVQLFTDASLVISLVGKYKKLSDISDSNVEKLVNFMNDNGGLTLNDLMEALKKKTGNSK
ncbi:hypothetical protein G5B47_12095 [Paenibacillus sp. 7124]|uniref:Uncharacterized protein n=1 Tax=Paenibacillus apii TaxID=1850370 RepID=A0A6M1PLY4_9BACL|nr:hypothetical protein [Paenibacillus apii]NGM83155.1 hypothetical protein [Paenibacillus apii]NJJ38803.1 hypothetical protein [Paenibacillus apii]